MARRRRRRNPVSPKVAGLAILGAAIAAAGVVVYVSTKKTAAPTAPKSIVPVPVVTAFPLV